MAGEVSAAEGALKAGADVVADTRTRLDGQINTLRGKLQNLDHDWKGQGGASFASLMRRWEEDAKKIIGALDTFEANLIQSQSTYTSTDDTQSSAMSRLTSRLG